MSDATRIRDPMVCGPSDDHTGRAAAGPAARGRGQRRSGCRHDARNGVARESATDPGPTHRGRHGGRGGGLQTPSPRLVACMYGGLTYRGASATHELRRLRGSVMSSAVPGIDDSPPGHEHQVARLLGHPERLREEPVVHHPAEEARGRAELPAARDGEEIGERPTGGQLFSKLYRCELARRPNLVQSQNNKTIEQNARGARALGGPNKSPKNTRNLPSAFRRWSATRRRKSHCWGDKASALSAVTTSKRLSCKPLWSAGSGSCIVRSRCGGWRCVPWCIVRYGWTGWQGPA